MGVVPTLAPRCGLTCGAALPAVPRAGPRNMRVFDPTTSSLTLSWDHAEGPVRQYKISYSPTGGDASSRVEIVSSRAGYALKRDVCGLEPTLEHHSDGLVFDPQTSVPGNRNNAKLENLRPDTPYSITVEPLYPEGPGAELSGNGRTGRTRTPPSRPFPSS